MDITEVIKQTSAWKWTRSVHGEYSSDPSHTFVCRPHDRDSVWRVNLTSQQMYVSDGDKGVYFYGALIEELFDEKQAAYKRENEPDWSTMPST